MTIISEFYLLEVSYLVQPALKGRELSSTSWRKEYQRIYGYILKPAQSATHSGLATITHVWSSSPSLSPESEWRGLESPRRGGRDKVEEIWLPEGGTEERYLLCSHLDLSRRGSNSLVEQLRFGVDLLLHLKYVCFVS